MADLLFEDPRLAAIYDYFDGDRTDLDSYLLMIKELKVKSILDVGCGTGTFACTLSKHGYEVTGLDPAKASLGIAMLKKDADKVTWVHGDSSKLINQKTVELAIMTGNVAQVFVDNEAWLNNLLAIKKALNPNGYLIFEVRDPAQKAWEKWNRENTYQKKNIPELGYIETWCEVTNVTADLVSFSWTYQFDNDEVLISKSTLRFRSKEEIITSLNACGFNVLEIRDAPDRPKQEFVFICQKEDL